jgi:hypothetical protein
MIVGATQVAIGVQVTLCKCDISPSSLTLWKWRIGQVGWLIDWLIDWLMFLYQLMRIYWRKKLIYIASHHSAAEHRTSTRVIHLTLFLASVLVSAQVLLTPLASSSTVLRHVFLGLPLPRLPWGFHSRACLAMTSGGFRSVWPSHPHLHFLICRSILGCFMRFHSSLFVIWSGQ